jgi:23S rRNA (guanosine2251-2'-O)-methyltransferase
VETVLGRNPVVEALREGVPARALLVAAGLARDERLDEAVTLAGRRGIGVHEVARSELDRLGSGHQGIGLQVPPYRYAEPSALVATALESPEAALLVALDGVTDARNLGAVVRSVAALGGHGVIVPERRSAGMTAGAWKASAGTAARLPVARATNLVRTLQEASREGLLVVGLAADGELDLDDLEAALDPLVLVVGSEGKGLSRLVREKCDLVVRIPLAGRAESLNASVAAGIALAEIARRRRAAARQA